ncbi:MAG: glucoamylase family protein [Terriglobales bacterium]
MSTISRRAFLLASAQTGFLAAALPWALAGRLTGASDQAASRIPLSDKDHGLLDELQRGATRFFWEAASPYTGLVKDRSQADGSDARDVASIAATGFGLTALCIADRRGYISAKKVRERVLVTLRFLSKRMPHQHGFYFHFIRLHTAERVWQCEVSTIDTAILLCGVLTCRQHFDDAEIRRLAREIYERVDWPWMLNQGETLSHGWKPESGFLKARWDTYNELMMLYLLGLGSPTHPLPSETWHAWKRPAWNYEGMRYIGSQAPLFVHQYSHAWFDFRRKRDRYADYFENSVVATKVHRHWCQSLAERFPHFGPDLWGITASDSAHGYVVWGGPPPQGPLDGTVVPCAAGGSIPFLPGDTLRVLHTMKGRFGKKAFKRYGFVDAFNPQTGWFAPDVIGIDLGITMLMAENARNGLVWETFMKNPEVRRAVERAGFQPDGSRPSESRALPNRAAAASGGSRLP